MFHPVFLFQQLTCGLRPVSDHKHIMQESRTFLPSGYLGRILGCSRYHHHLYYLDCYFKYSIEYAGWWLMKVNSVADPTFFSLQYCGSAGDLSSSPAIVYLFKAEAHG
jgi:hypothetical protein